jgi:hypothetical protein
MWMLSRCRSRPIFKRSRCRCRRRPPSLSLSASSYGINRWIIHLASERRETLSSAQTVLRTFLVRGTTAFARGPRARACVRPSNLALTSPRARVDAMNNFGGRISESAILEKGRATRPTRLRYRPPTEISVTYHEWTEESQAGLSMPRHVPGRADYDIWLAQKPPMLIDRPR